MAPTRTQACGPALRLSGVARFPLAPGAGMFPAYSRAARADCRGGRFGSSSGMTSRFLPIFRRGYEAGARRRAGAGLLLLAMSTAPGFAATPRLLPDRDASAIYQVSQPGKPEQTWRIRFDAAAGLVRATSLSGTPMPMTALLDLHSGRAQLVLPQMHALVNVPGLSGAMGQVMAMRDAHFTPLGTATIAGYRCTRYLVLRRNASGTACLTPDGFALAASGSDPHGRVSVQALSLHIGPQPAGDFEPPMGYSEVTLPPQMLASLLGQ